MSHPFTMPTIPADLAEIIATHRAMFGGFTMTANPLEGAEGVNPPANPPAGTPDPKPDEPLGEPGLKALQAERDARAKAEADLATLRKQVEDAGKSAEQKAADDLKAAQDVAATATLTALKYEVAADKGIDLKLAARLTGATKAELEADAENFKAMLGAKPTGTNSPKPDQSQGKGADGGKTVGVSAGRDLYRDTHPSSKTT